VPVRVEVGGEAKPNALHMQEAIANDPRDLDGNKRFKKKRDQAQKRKHKEEPIHIR